jgi:hypothetical protein
MGFTDLPLVRRLWIPYKPDPTDRSFMTRAQTQKDDEVEVTVAVLDSPESKRFFGVPMARHGLQPVWLRIVNRGASPYRLHLVSLDPNYYTPLEAAAACHYSFAKRLAGLGALAWIFLPLLALIPLKLIAAFLANSRMDEYFPDHAFRLRPIPPGGASDGFVFTSLEVGTKVVDVKLLGPHATKDFVFSLPVPGLDADHLKRGFENLYAPDALTECDLPELVERLRQQPRATTNSKGSRDGDPVNLVVIAEFAAVLSSFGARWDETEAITLATCWKTTRAFLFGSEYRYSPVSPLYLFGRSQDFSLQRVRKSINERLHLRLWMTPLRVKGLPVWVGQVSRDIGVRFTWRTWNLTTHRIDPDVDEARDYVVEDLLEAQHIDAAGYVDGVGECSSESPRRNLTGDRYYTDGKRAAILLSPERKAPRFIEWA